MSASQAWFHCVAIVRFAPVFRWGGFLRRGEVLELPGSGEQKNKTLTPPSLRPSQSVAALPFQIECTGTSY